MLQGSWIPGFLLVLREQHVQWDTSTVRRGCCICILGSLDPAPSFLPWIEFKMLGCFCYHPTKFVIAGLYEPLRNDLPICVFMVFSVQWFSFVWDSTPLKRRINLGACLVCNWYARSPSYTVLCSPDVWHHNSHHPYQHKNCPSGRYRLGQTDKRLSAV